MYFSHQTVQHMQITVKKRKQRSSRSLKKEESQGELPRLFFFLILGPTDPKRTDVICCHMGGVKNREIRLSNERTFVII